MGMKMKKIVIIGGGIAGLSAGVYGLLAGYEVSIYEKNKIAGGECMGWNRKGYHIDNCIHWLTGTKKGTELRKVWETVGALSPDSEFADTQAFYNEEKKKLEAIDSFDGFEPCVKEIKEDLEDTINKFKKDPKYTVQFFYEKIVSQWNNPTFQSFWINKARATGTGKEKAAIVKSVNGTGMVNKVISEYMNVIQSIILFGATVFVIINFKKNNGKQLIFAIMFIGGFLFHMVWEAKCQYTITYFVLLIPYSVRGYLQLSNIIDKKLKSKKVNK